MVTPALVRSQESDVNDSEAKKIVGRRAPRGQIQYNEDESIKIESGQLETTFKEYVARKKDHRGKSLVEGESDGLKFERRALRQYILIRRRCRKTRAAKIPKGIARMSGAGT
jgi:hypothetical protein